MLLSCSHWSAKPVWLNLGQHICLCSGVQLRQHFCSVMRFHPQRGHALGVCYRAACLFGLRCMEIRWKENHLAPGRGGIPKAPVSTGRIYHLAQPISLFLTPIQTTIGGQWENTELICTMHFTSLQALKSTVSFLRCSRDGPVRCYYNCWQISSLAEASVWSQQLFQDLELVTRAKGILRFCWWLPTLWRLQENVNKVVLQQSQ